MLTLQQLSDIGKELIGSLDKIKASNASIAEVQAEREALLKKNNNFKTFYDKFNNMAMYYETEKRWLDGTTYTQIPWTQIDDAAQRKTGNVHYTGSWDKYSPQITANINSNPTSTSGGHENITLNDTLQNSGLIALIDFMTTGQSGVSANTLDAPYNPGDPTITLTSGTQTIGKYLLISGSSRSALVLVTNASGTTITITEVIAPTGTIGVGGSVVENFGGFSNTELNTLTSVSYQYVLNELATRVINRVTTWETVLNSQLSQLNLNTDPDYLTQNNAAKTSINTAKTNIDTWQTLPNTGTLGTDSKFTSNNLPLLSAQYTARNSFRPTRASQITAALGLATQDSQGNIGGTGVYSKRFKAISLMINGIDGPLYQYYAKLKQIDVSKQTIQNEQQKQELFSTSVRSAPLAVNGTGANIVSVKSSSGFNIGDTVLLIANSQDDLQATITGISGNNVTLSKPVPNTYTLSLKSTIVKAI